MLLPSWVLLYWVLFAPVCAQTAIHLHEWHSVSSNSLNIIHGHVPTLIKDGTPISYTIGSKKSRRAVSTLKVDIDADANPYWILESTTDMKFVGLKPTPFKKSPNYSSISAEDRCPQLQPESRELLFSPFMYHVKALYSKEFLEPWINEDKFQQLIQINQLKYCVALSRQAMVHLFLLILKHFSFMTFIDLLLSSFHFQLNVYH